MSVPAQAVSKAVEVIRPRVNSNTFCKQFPGERLVECVNGCCRCFGLVRAWLSHDKRQRYQEQNHHSHHPKGIHKAQHIRLKIYLCSKLSERAMRRLTCVKTPRNEVLSHPVQHSFEEGIGVVGVSGKPRTVNLALSCYQVVQ